MRSPDDLPRLHPRSPSRGRVAFVVTIFVLFLLLLSFQGILAIWTDRLWFESLGRSGLQGVFDTMLGTKIRLAAVFTLAFFLLFWVNGVVADRLAPVSRPIGPEDEFIRRYQDMIERRAGLMRAAVSLFFAVVVGAGMASFWDQYLLWANRSDFGTVDKTFGRDIGFYVFELPWYSSVVDAVFAALTFVLFVTVVWHYVNGGIRLQAPNQRVTPAVKAHISVLLALLAVVKGIDYYLAQYQLVFSDRGSVIDGASYTDVNVQLPATHLLMVIAFAAAALFVVNVWRKGWVLPVVVVIVWFIVQLVAAAILPALVQTFYVRPAESQRQHDYIVNNIEATRQALNIVPGQNVVSQPIRYDAGTDNAKDQLVNHPDTVRNIRLLDPRNIADTFTQLQRQAQTYKFYNVDVDRYPVAGRDGGDKRNTAVVLSGRDLSVADLPQKTWENEHLAYTHGYGAVAAPANGVVGGGEPDFVVSDIPLATSDRVDINVEDKYRYLYFSEGAGKEAYSIVGTRRDEVGYLDKQQHTVPNNYDGEGGVPLDSTLKRLAFASRFDWNIALSEFVNDQSRIIYVRDVRERVMKAAPFLTWDADPYPVLVNGRIQYIIDGYTTTPYYPNAQRIETISTDALGGGGVRYIRNSVKAVVDAYQGSVELYVWDPTDPIIKAYKNAFPELFVGTSMNSYLQAHVRYPEDLFRVQTAAYGRYRVDDPQNWYEQSGAWSVALDPPDRPPTSASTPTTSSPSSQSGTKPGIDPFYVVMDLPGEPLSKGEFGLIRPFVPVSKTESASNQLLTGFMFARSDPGDNYGKLVVYDVITGDPRPGGPSVVNAQMTSNTDISKEISLLNQEGTDVQFGNMLIVPFDNTWLWVRPLFVSQTQPKLPRLKYVIVSFGDRSVMRPTLKEALAALFDVDVATLEAKDAGTGTSGSTSTTSPGPPGTGGPTGTGGVSGTGSTTTTSGETSVEALLAEADRLYDEANAALRDGRLDIYQQKVNEAQQRVKRARALAEPSTTSTTEAQRGSA